MGRALTQPCTDVRSVEQGLAEVEGSTITRRLRLQQLVSRLSNGFINRKPEEIDAHITGALGEVAQFLAFDIAAISKFSEHGRHGQVTHIWTAPELPPVPEGFTEHDFPWMAERHLQGEDVMLPTLDALPPEAGVDRATLQQYNVGSDYSKALRSGNTVIGALALVSIGHPRPFPAELQDEFELFSQVMANALARQRAATCVDEALAFERILTEVSRRLLAYDGAQTDAEIERGLRVLAGFFDVDRCTFWERSHDQTRFSVIHSYQSGQDIVPTIVLAESLPWFLQELSAGRSLLLKSLSDLPERAANERKYWLEHNLKSALLVPLQVGAALTGCLSLAAIRAARTWPPELVRRVQLAGEIFASALARKRTDQALRQSEERLTLAADSAGAGLWSLDLQTERFWLTNKTREIFRLAPDEPATLELILSLVHPEDKEFIRQAMRAAIQSREPHRVEFRIPQSDGTLTWALARGCVLCDTAGAPEYLMGVTVDNTAQKRVEESLLESEQRFRALVENAGDGFELLDEQGRFIDVNSATLAQLGYTREEMLALTVFDIDPSLKREQFRNVTRAAIPGSPLRVESVHQRKDGTTFPVEVTVSRVPLGGRASVITLVRDITERKRAELALKQTEERFRQVAENVGDFIWEVDANGLFTYTSPTVERILEYTPGELVGKMHFYDLFAPASRDDLKAKALKVFDARQNFKAFANPNLGKTGRLVHLETTGGPILGDSGELLGYRGATMDITARKLAEEALLRSYAEIQVLRDRLQAESDYLREEMKVTQSRREILGTSRGIQKVLLQIEQVAPTDSTVLICGETGTGKELVANAIHRTSRRKDHVMVMVNCAALPAALVESELFGRERGAYTGALTRQAGRFEVADKSTIFLDEIGDLSLDVQAKLLRVLEVGEFERLGSAKTVKVDVRLIAATNRDLAEDVRKHRFREDLFYRLNVFPINIPPLRERLEDIPEIVWALVREFSKRMGKKITRIPRNAMEALQKYQWPGNVRQLRNVIEHSVIITSGETLKVALPEDSLVESAQPATLAEREREHILQTLESTGWRIKGPKGAADKLGLKPSTLYTRMQKLGIPNRRQKLAA